MICHLPAGFLERLSEEERNAVLDAIIDAYKAGHEAGERTVWERRGILGGDEK